MRICFTLSSLAAGGAERVATSLANSFSKRGHEVILILVSINKNNSFYKIGDDVKVVPLLKEKKDKRFLRRIKLLRNELVNLKPDIVISFLPHICVYTYFALGKTNIPFICSERNDPNQYNLLYKILLKKSFYAANGCVFQTKDAKDFYKKVDPNKSAIIFNPVSINLSDDIIKKDKKDKIFISVGRLTPQKNFELLISSFARFVSLFPEYKLFIYGDGPLRQKLLKMIDDLNLSNTVFLPGTNPVWHDVALNAQGFVSSSSYEGMPNCLEEALCLGCPSIATDCPVGGSRELVKALGHGILIQPGNEKQLFEEMINITKGNYKATNTNLGVVDIELITNKWMDFIRSTIK